jgi:phenylacetaldehyde dehydrogenase
MNAAVAKEVELDRGVKQFIAERRRMLIDGEWVDSASGETIDVYNPATEEIVAHVPAGNAEDIDRAVAAARRAFEQRVWLKKTPSERGRIIWKIGDLLLEHLEEFAQLESLDNGKPVSVTRVADVPLAADMFHYMAGWATKIEGDTISLSVPYTPGAQYHAYTVKEPVGVVGQIIPWNFPLLMAAWKLAPALACGCTIVLKVAEETPLTGLRLGELIQEAGVPDGVVNIVTGYGEDAGAPLAAHPDVDKIAFTGSTEVGRLILKAAGGNLKKVSLELGGKSPNIVLADADMEVAIPGAANSIFFNHGQCCAAASRLFVQQKVFDKVAQGVADVASKMKLGPGLDPSTEMGPLVSSDQFERVTGFFESGEQEGARALTGGKRRGDKGYFVEPTVLVDTKPEMRVCAEEIFGPVVTAMPFKDMDEALVAAANDTVYGLASGIWTKDLSKAHTLASKLKAGTVWINCYNIFDAALPFGGYKQSGWGREMGHEVLKNYLETKSVCVNLA